MGDPGLEGEEKTTESFIRADNPIAGRYIVVLADAAMQTADVDGASRRLSSDYAARVDHTYRHAIRGFSAEMSETDALALARDPRVAWVEEDSVVSIGATQSGATWGLDRIDQASLPLDSSFTYADAAGSGVRAYVVDTGINANHVEFTGRVLPGYDFVSNDSDPTDCNGHGTHVAGTVAGTTYGVAKAASITAVRVLDCSGSGSTSGVIAGVDWVAANAVLPAVANMSLGGTASTSLDDAVQRAINAGVTFVVAAGNENTNACNGSPSRAPNAITVGSTTNTDARSSFSNYGSCVDIFAPGSSITSAWYTSNSATDTISGTSMASPHVAGAAALYLSVNPTATPQQVRDALVAGGISGAVSNPGTGSPNVLLNVAFITGGNPPPPPPPPTGTSFSYTGSNTNSAQQNTTNQSITLAAGDVLTVGTCGLTGSAFTGDTYVRLNGTAGTEVTANDDACGGLGSQIVYTAPSSGTYSVRAGCYGNTSCTGTVVWSIAAGPPPPPPAPNNFTYSATNTNNATRNTTNRTIALTAGQTLTIGTCGVTGSAFTGDTWIRLRTAAGTQVASNDDACGGTGSQIVYRATSSGNFELRAGCYSTTSCNGTVAWTIQ